LRIGAIAALCLGVVAGGYLFYVLRSGEGRLQRLFDELDRNDPGWRLEELEARRKVIPPEQNSARQIDAVRLLGMSPWPLAQQKSFDDLARDLSPEVQLPQQAATTLRKGLKKAEPALVEARKLADMPNGRFPITYSADGIATLVPHGLQTREVAEFLKLDALLRSAEGDIDGALASGRGILNTGRARYDEPMAVSQLIRVACTGVALKSVERSLAQGEPSEAALVALGRLLEDEEAQPLLRIALRGERAGVERFIQALRSGSVAPAAGFLGRPVGRIKIRNFDIEELACRFYLRTASEQHAALLEQANAIAEVAKLPAGEQIPQLERLEAALGTQPFLFGIVIHKTSKVAEAFRRTQAGLRCALVAVALERYRRTHSGWPDSLAPLVPAYLPSVPIDPYDGAPLRYRRLADRLVVYSVGLDKQDNGGNVGKVLSTPGTDVGLRLWDVKHRRQRPTPWSALRPLLWKTFP
jgi:hypothetical protein